MQENRIDTEPILLCSLSDEIQADMVIAALKKQQIPALKKSVGTGQYLTIFMGFSTQGVEIYTSPELIDKAREVMNAIMGEGIDNDDIKSELPNIYHSRRIIMAILLLLLFCAPVILLILRLIGLLFIEFRK